jgi:hypothetical protein
MESRQSRELGFQVMIGKLNTILKYYRYFSYQPLIDTLGTEQFFSQEVRS